MKLQKLTEATSIDQAAKELNQISKKDMRNDLEVKLDAILRRNLQRRSFDNNGDSQDLLIIGPAGSGKTSIVKSWAKEKNLNLVAIDLAKSGPETIGGIMGYDPEDPSAARQLRNKPLFDALSKPNSVLLLDEYNRAKSSIRSTILKLVQEHVLPGSDGDVFLPNLLFTIAIQNPDNGAYEVNKIDPAEISRFEVYYMVPDPLSHLAYIKKYFGREIEAAKAAGDAEWEQEALGRIGIAETLLKDKRFEYTSDQEEVENSDNPMFRPTNSRSLMKCLNRCDGTKDNFLELWNSFCNPAQKTMVEQILKNYVDVKDKANDALAKGTSSEVFKKTRSNFEKIMDIVG